MLNASLKKLLSQFYKTSEHLTVLTGAGISAESGIPTFRGPEGYWSIGSHEYHPQEMATLAMFSRYPEEVWRWYLYRRGVCRQAQPNAGHEAVVALERLLEQRFTLITQNVDGLHLCAGSSLERTFQIHGNIQFMRCTESCSTEIFPIPESLPFKSKQDPFTAQDRAALRCPYCEAPTRPHVLWFDESYDEEHYRFHSSMQVAQHTALLIVVGTSGATTLPNYVVGEVLQHGGMVIDVNIERDAFADVAMAQGNGYFLQYPSGQVLPEVVKALQENH